MAGLPEGEGERQLDEAARARFRLTKALALTLPSDALVLDPLPRVDEIDSEVDELSVAGYFSQSRDALYVRCAVLEHILHRSS